MINIIIDKEMLIKELYHIRSFVEPEQEQLKQKITDLVDLITKAPVSERNALIDELIGEVGMISHLFVTEKVATRYIDPEEVVKLLKSKKK